MHERSQRRRPSKPERQVQSGRAVYVKRHELGVWLDTDDVVKARAAREVEIINRLASLPRLGGRLGAVKVVRSDLENATVVTDEVPGQPLQTFFASRNARVLHQSVTRGLHLAGRWLREFQKLPTDSDVAVSRPADPEDFVEYCDFRLRTMNEMGYAWADEKVRTRTLVWLREQLSAADPEDHRLVWSHGDYGPFNLMWDGHCLTPIDFETSKLEFPLLDVVYLINRIEMLPIQFPWRRWPIALWRRACLRGYGCADAIERPIYRAIQVRHLLCRLQTLVRTAPTSQAEAWHNRWVRACLKRRLNRILFA